MQDRDSELSYAMPDAAVVTEQLRGIDPGRGLVDLTPFMVDLGRRLGGGVLYPGTAVEGFWDAVSQFTRGQPHAVQVMVEMAVPSLIQRLFYLDEPFLKQTLATWAADRARRSTSRERKG